MSGYTVRESTFLSHKAYHLSGSDSPLRAVILPGVGSNLISLHYQMCDGPGEWIPVLREPADPQELAGNPRGYGFPVLVPPSRIKDAVFIYNGREYVFPKNENGTNHIHGLVYSKEWTVEDASAGDDCAEVITSFDAGDYDDVMDAFHHRFKIRLSFRLTGNKIEIGATAENLSDDPMPFGIGYHPWFNVPLLPESSKPACSIRLGAQKYWELDELYPTGRILDVSGKRDLRDWRSLDSLLLDDVFNQVEVDEQGKSTCEYRDEGIGSRGVTVRFRAGAPYAYWVIYTGRTTDSDFVCLEPYTWVPNAPNLSLPDDVTGFRTLRKGEPFVSEMEVAVSQL